MINKFKDWKIIKLAEHKNLAPQESLQEEFHTGCSYTFLTIPFNSVQYFIQNKKNLALGNAFLKTGTVHDWIR